MPRAKELEAEVAELHQRLKEAKQSNDAAAHELEGVIQELAKRTEDLRIGERQIDLQHTEIEKLRKDCRDREEAWERRSQADLMALKNEYNKVKAAATTSATQASR